MITLGWWLIITASFTLPTLAIYDNIVRKIK